MGDKQILKMTREEAISYHRKLWEVLHLMCKRKQLPTVADGLKSMGLSHYMIKSDNFLCEYAMQVWTNDDRNRTICEICPIKFTDDGTPCVRNNNPYGEYRLLYCKAIGRGLTDEDWEKFAEVCKTISELPEK